ncbi:MAG: NAD(P)-dependent oxidoreductase [Anaerolineae bacterium]
MPTLDTRQRTTNFEELELGYSRGQALAEASRCLACPEPQCVKGCPVNNDIPGFIQALVNQDFQRGVDILRRTTNFPAICGRVCDFARQCEGACVLAQEGGDPIAIGALERFLGDWERTTGQRHRQAEHKMPPTGRRIAIVGSGPSGLACASDLAMRGHHVTIFESLPVIGGAMAWGIPTFRLPPPVLEAEIELLRAVDVDFQLNTTIGEDLTIDDLFAEGFDAAFIGAGTTVPYRLRIPGEKLDGVYSATEFLTHARLSHNGQVPGYQLPQIGERLAVIGAGNTAMDVAQTAVRLGYIVQRDGLKEFTSMDVAETALRLGFREVTVVYRRSESEMPARREEVAAAREEGVRFMFLTTPVRFIGNEQGRLVAMECQAMGLGAPDSSGRRRPVPKAGTEFTLPVDTAVLALGYQADNTLTRTTDGLATNRWGLITADSETGRTTRDGVWAGGDIVIGADTVVRAMGAGKRAARDIDRYLMETK